MYSIGAVSLTKKALPVVSGTCYMGPDSQTGISIVTFKSESMYVHVRSTQPCPGEMLSLHVAMQQSHLAKPKLFIIAFKM